MHSALERQIKERAQAKARKRRKRMYNKDLNNPITMKKAGQDTNQDAQQIDQIRTNSEDSEQSELAEAPQK